MRIITNRDNIGSSLLTRYVITHNYQFINSFFLSTNFHCLTLKQVLNIEKGLIKKPKILDQTTIHL